MQVARQYNKNYKKMQLKQFANQTKIPVSNSFLLSFNIHSVYPHLIRAVNSELTHLDFVNFVPAKISAIFMLYT